MNPTRKTLLLLFGCVCTAQISSVAAPIVLHVDNTHSSIQFAVPFVGITEVTGRFERFCGVFNFDEKNMSGSSLELFIEAASINTGLKIRDRDLRNDYLNTKEYPVIYFRSSNISSQRPKTFDVMGQLTMHGKTKHIQLKLLLVGDIINDDGGRELGLKIQPISMRREDFGIMEGSRSVGDSITVNATIRVRDVSPYRKDFDAKHPETNEKNKPALHGKYVSSSGKTIVLSHFQERNFIAFDDDEWMWLSELRSVGQNTFKSINFNNLVEIKNDQLVFTTQENSEIFKLADP
jgi:polyisoprenoid-binding protein YceI